MKHQLDISIIIVNYNVKSYLEQALHSIQKALKGIPSEIFVVDNASTDGSVAMLRNRFADVHLVVNKQNTGFAKANNQAIEKAIGRYVCLINPDTIVQEDTFQTCLDFMENHPEAGMAGCKILNPDGSLQLACRRSFPTPWVGFTKAVGLNTLFPKSRLFGRYNLTFLDPDEIAEVQAVSGSFMFVRKQAIDQSGLLDEAFFMYGEDLDWCYRIHSSGWKIFYIPATQIIHYKGRSAKEAPFDNLRVFYGAMQLFVRKHFHKGWAFIPQWLLMAGIVIRSIIGFLSQLFRRIFIPAIDFLFLQIGLFIAILLWLQNLSYWPRYLLVNGLYTLIWLGCFWGMGLYRKGVFSASNAIGAVFFGFVINTSVTFFLPEYQFSRAVMLITAFLDAFLLGSWRMAIRLITRRSRSPIFNKLGDSFVNRRAVIVGTNAASQRIFKQLRSHPDTGYEIIGLLSLQRDSESLKNIHKLPLLGSLEDIERVVKVHRIHEVIFPAETVAYDRLLELMTRGRELHLDFKMAPRESEVLIGRSHVDALDDLSLMDLEYPIFQGWHAFSKRLFDLAVVFCLLPFALMMFIWVLLHPKFHFRKCLISDGFGRSLTIHQIFNNEKMLPNLFQIIIYLIPIIRGKMSIVGTEIIPFQSNMQPRGYKPGITGLVQVYSNKNLTEEEKKRYTYHYMKSYSIFLDIEILLKAILRSSLFI